MRGTATVDRRLSDLVGALTDPIIVCPGGWGDSLPDWLKNAITLERLAMNMKGLNGETVTGTDAEACAYLYTAALTAPMHEAWAEVYFYIATKACQRWGKTTLPSEIAVDSLDDYHMAKLHQLKAWLHRTRRQARLSRRWARSRSSRAEVAVKKEAMQPVLFGL